MSDVFIIIDFNSICRFCLESKGVLSSIFVSDNETSLVSQIEEVADIEVRQDDDLPPKVCHRCRFKIEQSFDFIKMIEQSQRALQDSIMDVNKSDFNHFGPIVDSHANKTIEYLNSKLDSVDAFDESAAPQDDSQERYNSTENEVRETLCTYPDIFEDAETVELFVENDVAERTLDGGGAYSSQYPSIFTAHKKNQCLLCLEKFNDEESLHGHVDSHVRGTTLIAYYKLKDHNVYCKACERHFDYRFNFLIHQREHLNIRPFVCLHPGCEAAYYSNTLLKQHMQIHGERQFICPTCGIGFKRKTDLRGHEIIHEDADRKYRCELCNLLFKNRLTYGCHRKKHHTRPSFNCDHCPKKYFSRSELSRHLHIHDGVKKFQCDMCSCAYFSQSALKRHVRCHSQPKTHRCVVCAAVCGSWGELVDHKKQHLSEKFPYKCPCCDKGYYIKPSLSRHMATCTKKDTGINYIGISMEDVKPQHLTIDMIESIEKNCKDAGMKRP